MFRFLRKCRDALVGRRLVALPESVYELQADVKQTVATGEKTIDDIARLSAKLSSIEEEIDGLSTKAASDTERLISILHVLADQESDNRRRLWDLRSTKEYEEAFTLDSPLVSIVIPTYDNLDLLMTRSLPSALNQTYKNIEIVVVGDNASSETKDAMDKIEDPRVSYFNLNRRGPYPKDSVRLWFVAGIPPWNEAVRRSKGHWITPLPDDDSIRPEHIETLVKHAQEHRYEVCYGKIDTHTPDGGREVVGEFPPSAGQFGFQACVYHSGLKFMEMELFSDLFDFFGDLSLVIRMLRAGVYFGMVDAVVADYYPSVRWRPRRDYDFAEGIDQWQMPSRVVEAF